MSSTPYALRVELSDGQSFTHELASGRAVLGRASTADVTLREDGVSREHAQVLAQDGALWIEDLGSTNGTRVNGKIIAGRTQLADGDQIAIGRALATVQVDARQSVDQPGDSAKAGLTPDSSIASTQAVDDEELLRLTDDRRALRTLYQLGQALDPQVSEGELRRRIVELALATLEPERVVLRLGDDELTVGSAGEGVPAPASAIVDRVLREARAVLTMVEGPPARSVLAVPVRLRERAQPGLLYVDAPADRRRFLPRDLDLLTILAHQAAALLDNARLVRELRGARDRLADENVQLRSEMQGRFVFAGILGDSGKLQETLRTVHRLSQTDSTVLITGESRTGKELVARTIHFNSARRTQPFLAINCAAIPENLLEAELFGIEKGVATGVDRRAGKFEAAGEGTLFLDEIGELPLSVQAKLLRVLEERVVERVGGRELRPVKARIVTATNRNLSADAAAGRFREDLFYRLNVVPLRLPPLRERQSDIALLAGEFLRRFATQQRRPIRGFAPEALAALEAWHWPGNVRELQNELERVVTVWEPREGEGERADLVHLDDLSEHVRVAQARPGRLVEELEPGDIKEVVAALVERAERQLIRAALAKTRDNRVKAAALLGLTREGLRKKMIRYGMD